MSKATETTPAGPPITPHLAVVGTEKAIEFYARAFGAENTELVKGQDGTVMHCSMVLPNGGVFYMMESRSQQLPTDSPVILHLEVPDVDAAWKRAIEAGASVVIPLENQFWGARYGMLRDPFGHRWSVATQLREVSSDELKRAARSHRP